MLTATVDVPLWGACFAAIALPAIGWLTATLRLTHTRDEVKGDLAELKRLTDWNPPAVPREPGADPWPEPLSPRAHERQAVVDKAPALDLAPTEAIVGAHAAPPAMPNWHRGEHRAFTWGWLVELGARAASIGYRPRLVEHVPTHAAWSVEDDAAVAAEVQRHMGGFERAIVQVFDDFVHMGGAR